MECYRINRSLCSHKLTESGEKYISSLLLYRYRNLVNSANQNSSKRASAHTDTLDRVYSVGQTVFLSGEEIGADFPRLTLTCPNVTG